MVNDSRNVITIKPAPGSDKPGTMFRAPADIGAAKSLWAWLVENIQPGFVVELFDGEEEVTRPSGEKLPAELYAGIMEGTRE